MIPLINTKFGRPGPAFDRMQFGPNLRPLKEMVVGNLGDTMWLLMGTIGLLLLIACANVANLVLVRTQSRRPELSVRTALGARWSDIARMVLAENAVLGLAGGVVGVAVAYFSLPYLLTLGDDLPYIMTVRIDPTVLLAALAISALATFAFPFIPARSPLRRGLCACGVAARRAGRSVRNPVPLHEASGDRISRGEPRHARRHTGPPA